MAYGSTEVPATAFAITTVNVPDRLDLRDMDDRKQLEDDYRQRRFDLTAFRIWAPRLLFIAIFAGLAFVALEVFDTWRTSLSAQQLSQRLSSALGLPVQIESSQFAIRPAPRLVLTHVSIDHKVVLNEVSVNVGTRHIAQVLQGRGWNWGEAVVGPMALTLEQCRSLLDLLPKLDAALPKSLATLRFDRLQIAEQPWLAGPWQVDVAREGKSGFLKATAESRAGSSLLRFVLTPDVAAHSVNFQMEAENWTMPFGAPFPMEDALATGQVSENRIDIPEYSMGGSFGAVRGMAAADLKDGVWSVNGTVTAEGLDLAALLRLLAPTPAASESAAADSDTALQGNASFSGKFEGKGATLTEATAGAVFAAPVQVRWPVLNGINLGYAATHPGGTNAGGGGTTRFSTLSAVVVAGGDVISMRDIRAHAGALAVSGQVEMNAAHALSGVLHVDLGASRILAPIRVAVHGTVAKPQFGH